MQKVHTPERKAWRKPVVKVHGDLAALTRAKNPVPGDSGLGQAVS